MVEFDATIAPEDLRVEFDPAVSTDIVLRIAGSDDRITILGGQNLQTLGFVRFADGTEWTQADVLARGLVPLSENVSVPSNDDVLTGSVYDDVIDGGQGNDVLIGLAGDDHLIGGTGNDIFNAGPGLDTTEDIRGDDTYLFAAGDGRLIIADADGADAIEFAAGILPGDVTVRQNAAGDILLLIGAGNDRVTILGGLANPANRIEEVRFDDTTVWTATDLIGFSLTGTDASQNLIGSSFDDVVDAGGGDDIVAGADGDDQLSGGAGSDVLAGEAGDDRLAGGSGADILDGGLGDDTFIYNLGDGQDSITDEDGFDVVLLGPGIAPGSVCVTRDGKDLVLHFANPGDRLTLTDALFSGDIPSADQGIDEIRFDDTTVWTLADAIAALPNAATAGDDLIIGTDADDIIDGLAGDDRIRGQNGDDIINGGDGDDYIDGGYGANTLSGGAGDDEIDGGSGDDVIIGGTGNDDLDGSSGSDIYRFALGDGEDRISDFTTGNIIEFAADIAPGDVAVSTLENWRPCAAHCGHRWPTYYVRGLERSVPGKIAEVRFSDGEVWTDADLVAMAQAGTAGPDIIVGSDSEDTLTGLGGDDRIFAENGNDIIDGGDGDDYIFADYGDDDITGGAGDDELQGSYGEDTYRYNLGDGREHNSGPKRHRPADFRDGITVADITVARVVQFLICDPRRQ